mgnify:CR=1 FL=1
MITIKPETHGDKPKQNIFNSQVKSTINSLQTQIDNIVSPNATTFKRINFTPAPDGVNNIFTLEYELEPDSEQIKVNGAFLYDPSDYTLSGTQLEFLTFTPYNTDTISIFGTKLNSVGEKRVPFSPAPDGVNNAFTLDYEIETGTDQIFVSGAFLYDSSDYTLSGTTLTFNFVPYDTDKIIIFGKEKV